MTSIVEYLGGLKMSVIDGDQGMSSLIRLFGIHEPMATKAIMKILKPGDTIIDIGSNLGYYAFIEARAVGSEGRVFALEPAPESFQKLLEGINVNMFDNIKPFRLAIGNLNGSIPMNIGNMSNASNVVDTTNENLSTWAASHLNWAMKEVVQVEAMTLDEFTKENNITGIDMIRMDVEGYEIEILANSLETLQNRMNEHSTLFIEMHPIFYKERTKYLDLTNYLKTIGYKPLLVNSEGELNVEATDEMITNTDVYHVFFVR